jgi:hypothetical protein
MAMKKTIALYTLLLHCLASTAMLAQQVSVNYNHNASFAQYHTYARGSDDKNKIRNSILAQVAQQDIEAAMQQKGSQKVEESQNPDLILTANAESTSRPLITPGACAESAAEWVASLRSRT